MAVYAIGDLQGCYNEFRELLDRLNFEPARDTLWLTGDLVNRGPHSLEVLRFVRDLRHSAITVLGNHDLHLLAVSLGKHRHVSRNDTLDAFLAAPDREELLDWLRRQPLLHHDAALGWTMVHAGLSPAWDMRLARSCATEVETALRGPDFPSFVDHMYGNEPVHWQDELAGWERLRYTVNCLTRLRYCHEDGSLALAHKGAPEMVEPGLLPWFRVPGRRTAGARVVCGHWSTLGLYRGEDVLAIDTGCLWGGALTAARLDTPDLPPYQLPCKGARRPGED
jgi:bis(5'-nucleosyl)-tetraphosphatase (symmetrical)